MKITSDYLLMKWSSFNFHEGGYKQIEVDHRLEWYIGYKEINQKTILVISTCEPELLPSSKSLLVSKGKRVDGRWALSITLMRPEQDSVFETLCADIISFSLSSENEKNALHLVSKRYKQWNLLLEHLKKSLMDESSRRGLIGELIFLVEIINSGYPPLSAVQGWVGPDGADQDFVYSQCWYEIKAAGASASSISISSLEQLSSIASGQLVVMRLDKCAPEKNGGFSLGDIVDQTLDLVKNDPLAFTELETRITRYGYIDLPEYKEQKYIYSGKQRYCVDEEFPRLTKDDVPVQIVSAQYSISLAGIEAWRMDD